MPLYVKGNTHLLPVIVSHSGLGAATRILLNKLTAEGGGGEGGYKAVNFLILRNNAKNRGNEKKN